MPHDYWKTLTFIAALRHNRFDAPCIIDSPINGDLFAAYVEQLLVPTRAPGGVVILDNIGSNKGQRARRAIRGAGAHILVLPPYSLGLNPIERLFAKLKHLMRAAQQRTVEATWRKVATLIDIVTPNECTNHLVNSEYAAIKKKHALIRPSAQGWSSAHHGWPSPPWPSCMIYGPSWFSARLHDGCCAGGSP